MEHTKNENMAEIQKIQHLRSSSPSVAGGTLAKAPANLLSGQIAINDISSDPTIFLKDSSGAIIEFKGRTFVENLVNTLAGGAMLADVGYRNVLEVATTLKTFLTGTNDADIVINKWTELQNFLNAIPDSAITLIDMFAALAGNGLQQTTTTAGNGTKSVKLSVKNSNDSLTVDANGVKVDTQNNFASTSPTKPLSAAQGKLLHERLLKYENAFTIEGSGTEADPFRVRVNYDIYSLGEVSAYGAGDGSSGGGSGGGAGALYECADTAIGNKNSSTTPSKVLAAGDILRYDGTHWRNVANEISLVNGLEAIITELRRVVSSTNAGLMSSTDKNKLDGIQSGANNYVHPESTITPGTYKSVTVDSKGHITEGSNPTKLSEYGITDAAPSSHVGAGGTAHAVASTSVNGFMSSADKLKLNGIAAGANNYVHPTTAGNKHIPAGGAAGNILTYAADGTASWANVIDCGTY